MKHLAILTLVLVAVTGTSVQMDGVRYRDVRESPSADSIGAGRAERPATDRFVSRGRTTVALQPNYAAGSIWRWLFGDNYRDVWTTSIEVPIISLEKTAGGLTPVRRGGGQQTATLHLRGADGLFYELRSVNKDVSRSIPDAYRAPLIRNLVQDQMSALNPLAAGLAAPLARAAGILHLDPVLVMIPDASRLGAFREEFAGMLALFERDPDEDQSDAARFGYSKNIVGTEKLVEELREDSADRVDERAYARARLFDMLIGDWDRHDGQWRWAEFETDRGTRYVPVPTDRDVAFSRFDGILVRLARKSGRMMFRRLGDFDAEIRNVFDLNWQARRIDRRIATSLTREDWVEIADSLKLLMTDDAIDQAVRTWPDSVYEVVGPSTARFLKSRRDTLPAAASRYYELLARSVSIFGSDADERFEITRLSGDRTRVVFRKRLSDAASERELYSRLFLGGETEEIRIFGFGGNDQVILYGKADGEPLVRIKGGHGSTALIDSSAFEGPSTPENPPLSP